MPTTTMTVVTEKKNEIEVITKTSGGKDLNSVIYVSHDILYRQHKNVFCILGVNARFCIATLYYSLLNAYTRKKQKNISTSQTNYLQILNSTARKALPFIKAHNTRKNNQICISIYSHEFLSNIQ